ncbi:MAG: isocitrate lyase/phosphoenolpyruvate mutase family protein [Burkholderiaceae bacterium]
MTRPSQLDKANALQALHAADRGFVIPNPWDAGSAILLENMGFKALASTSAGFAWSRGRPDNAVSRDALLGHLRELVEASGLPISADLENGFGEAPEECAKTILLAAETGVAGGSIEDSTGRPGQPLFERAHAAERVRAAVAAARSLGFPFALMARAENYFVGVEDLPDVIARLQAYEAAGADVLYAPGLVRKEDIALVLREIGRPLNVLLMPAMTIGVPELLDMGVQRISVGGTLARAAWGGFMRAAQALKEQGAASYAKDAAPGKELNAIFGARPRGED